MYHDMSDFSGRYSDSSVSCLWLDTVICLVTIAIYLDTVLVSWLKARQQVGFMVDISTDGVVDTFTTRFVSMKGFLVSWAVTVEISTVKIVIILW